MTCFNRYGDVTDSFKRKILAHYNSLIKEGENKRDAGYMALSWANDKINEENEVLAHGIEFAADSFGSMGNFCQSGIKFINMGDMYYSNICYDVRQARFRWLPVADIIEREHIRFNQGE